MAGARELRIVVDDGVGNLSWGGIPLGVPAGERDRLVLLGTVDTIALVGAQSAILSASGELILEVGDVFYDTTLGTIVGTTNFILVGVETRPAGGGDVVLDINPSFRGSGALSATLKGPSSSTAAFDGDGTLAATTTAVIAAAAELEGDGSLTATATATLATAADLDGEGTLSATATAVHASTADLRSEGTLWVGATADGLMAAAGRAIPVSVGV